MTEVYKTYNIAFFENILWNGFQFEVPHETMDLISSLAYKVGAPNYVKTPIFTKSNNNNSLTQKRRKNDGGKHSEINEDDWKAIRDFKATTLKKSEGVEKTIDHARTILNKLSANNYDKMVVEILDIIKENEHGDSLTDEDTTKLIGFIFETACSNTFCSELYAQLVVDLLNHSPMIKDLFHKNKMDFVKKFDNIEVGDPNKDYDRFCEINFINDARKGSSMFLVNLIKLEVIIPQEIINIIHTLQENLLEVIEEQTNSGAAEEIAENLFILIKGGYEQISKLGDWETVIGCVESVSKMKANSKPGLKHKCIFKHMDIMDAIKKMK